MSHLNFSSLSFSTNFCPDGIGLSGSTIWPKASGFKKWTILGRLDEIQFARHVEWDFLGDFPPPCGCGVNAFRIMPDLVKLNRQGVCRERKYCYWGESEQDNHFSWLTQAGKSFCSSKWRLMIRLTWNYHLLDYHKCAPLGRIDKWSTQQHPIRHFFRQKGKKSFLSFFSVLLGTTT